jgi:hypothetical protein
MSMTDRVLDLIVDESKWLTFSLALACLAVVMMLARSRQRPRPWADSIGVAMSLFFAVTIGTMAAGHLLAVTVKLAMGTLDGGVLRFYLIGAALAVPSWSLLAHVSRLAIRGAATNRTTVALNVWVAGTLLAMGLHNLPLAAPGLINMIYLRQPRPMLGWALVGLSVVVNLGLLAGSLVFLASGQSFEQFRGIQ